MKSLIVLVGLPGAGKSTAAAALARELGWNHLDIDSEIERRTGMTIGQIFAERGEAWFRRREEEVSAELAKTERTVVAAGGGWMSNPLARPLLVPVAGIIYLRVTPATALSRLGLATSTRPILYGPNPLGRLEGLYQYRRGDYEAADAVVDVETLDPKEVTKHLVALVAKLDIIR